MKEWRPCHVCSVSVEDPSVDDLLMALCLHRQVMEVSLEAPAADRGRCNDEHVFHLSIADVSTAEALELNPALWWGISVEHVVQLGFRSVLHPALSRCFWSNDCQLWCKRLPVTRIVSSGT
jgi:hypothetical protein